MAYWLSEMSNDIISIYKLILTYSDAWWAQAWEELIHSSLSEVRSVVSLYAVSQHSSVYCIVYTMCSAESMLRALQARTLAHCEDTWSIRPSGLGGRGMFAYRDLLPGDTICHVHPILAGKFPCV